MAKFEVWSSPGGCIYAGDDQEDAILAGLSARDTNRCIEIFEDRGRGCSPRRVATWGQMEQLA